ncbi:MAG TPA: DUF4339 domain-containing protein [bacterium]|nr:DUF4339 domain-containing protein [bacterium]
MTDDRSWFLYTAAGSQGPYTAAELQAFLVSGQISTEWHVWREGMAEWQQIAATIELIPESEPVAGQQAAATESVPVEEPAPVAADCTPAAVSMPAAAQPAAAGGLQPAVIKPTGSSTPSATTSPRPGCITLLCVLLLLVAALHGFLLFTKSGSSALAETELGSFERAWVFFGFLLILGAAIGLWRMQKWGLWMYLVVAVVDLLITFSASSLVMKAIVISGLWKYKDAME